MKTIDRVNQEDGNEEEQDGRGWKGPEWGFIPPKISDFGVQNGQKIENFQKFILNIPKLFYRHFGHSNGHFPPTNGGTHHFSFCTLPPPTPFW